MDLQPLRTIAELKELRALTGDEAGAQRVAFTPGWQAARKWLLDKLGELPVETHLDAAGNIWSTLTGESSRALLIGGHLDSVPNGGWLDGSLNMIAGLEVMRRLASEYKGRPPVTVRLVDWADEEGARFGRSLLGSSACSGQLDLEEVRGLRDRDGMALPEALQEIGIDFEKLKHCERELHHAAASIELHIEQGPVLLELGLPLGAVLGTCGVERHAITFYGQAAHSGSTPMARRRDAFLAAGKMSQEIYHIAERSGGGVCTIGSCETRPGIVTSVVQECRITLDQRHLNPASLAVMLAEAQAASEVYAAEGNVQVKWERLWQIEPRHFHPELIELCAAAIEETSANLELPTALAKQLVPRLPSGALHDSASICAAGIPTVMMFTQSLHGISHNKMEDTEEAHLVLAVEAFDRLASKVIHWIK